MCICTGIGTHIYIYIYICISLSIYINVDILLLLLIIMIITIHDNNKGARSAGISINHFTTPSFKQYFKHFNANAQHLRYIWRLP